MTAAPRSPSIRGLGALAPVVLCAALLAAVSGAASGANSTTVVTATVPSATSIAATGCASGAAGVTSFGTVLPGISVATSADCVVSFGSSNDTSTLRLRQTDGYGDAMHAVTWQVTPPAVGAPLGMRKVDFAQDGVAWQVGYAGWIARSADNGRTWTRQAAGLTTTNVFAVEAVDTRVAWGSTDGGLVVRTTDGGTTWSQWARGGVLRDIAAVDRDVAWVVGNAGALHRTTDGGLTWQNLTANSGVTSTIWSITALDSQRAWFSTAGGVIRVTADGGATWTTQATPVTTTRYAIDAIDSQRLVSVGALGEIIVSANGGTTWTAVTSPTASLLWDMDVGPTGQVLAVGDGGGVATSSDFGATWQLVPPVTSNSLRGAAIVDEATMLAAGEGGTTISSEGAQALDYAAGTADWSTAATQTVFGACLRAADMGAVTSATTWSTTGSCAVGNAQPWRGVAATSSSAGVSVANAPTGDVDATVRLRFGLRVGSAAAPGIRLAPLTFEVVSPGT